MVKKHSRYVTIVKRALLPAAALSVMGFFGMAAITGPTGMLAYGDYKAQLTKREAVYARLDRDRTVMKNRVELLDPRHVDPDLADELTRSKLNVVRPDEVIVPLKK